MNKNSFNSNNPQMMMMRPGMHANGGGGYKQEELDPNMQYVSYIKH